MTVSDMPGTWKGLAGALVATLGEIGYALHRIAGALEGDSEKDEPDAP